MIFSVSIMEIDRKGNDYACPSLDRLSSVHDPMVGGPLANVPELSKYGSQTVVDLSAVPSPNTDESFNINVHNLPELDLGVWDHYLHHSDGLEVRLPVA